MSEPPVSVAADQVSDGWVAGLGMVGFPGAFGVSGSQITALPVEAFDMLPAASTALTVYVWVPDATGRCR